MSANALTMWFARIFDTTAIEVVAERAGAEVAERVMWGRATIADLFVASTVLGRSLAELLPLTLDQLDGLPHELDRRNAERLAQGEELMHIG
ncbi:hypothetical protein [Nocardia sp. NPDC127526]|uniref:hypothetical protein n=1 Tax=Nocardia sp. NPDC127526 TaxID=3345393 RepID=UPI00362CBF41